MMVVRTLALFLCINAITALKPTTPSNNGWTHRRNFFQTVAAGVVSSSVVTEQVVHATEEVVVFNDAAPISPPEESPFRIYQVIADSSESLNPILDSVDMTSFLQRISPQQGGALWLGEHHNSMRDHKVQAKLLRDLHNERSKLGTKVAVGFEQIQVQFQPVLDRFVAGQLSLEELKFMVQWDKRWVWPFEVYQDIFTAAQELHIPLVALNVNSEDLHLVEQGGLPALPRETLLSYIVDPKAFAQFSSGSKFGAYVDYVIRPSYDLHLALGLLQQNKNTMSGEVAVQSMPFRNFFSGRILWDEAMANRAYSWTRENQGGLLLGLVGADHVKFGNGIPARYARMAGSDQASVSVLINPTLTDSRPSGSVIGMPGVNDGSRPDQLITLQLRYLKDGVDRNSPERFLPSSTGGVLPLADFLLFG